MRDRTRLVIFIATFVVLYFMPVENMRVRSAILEAILMLQEYAREHVLFCLIPAFFIAGAISIFVSKEAVIKYFGARARRIVAYSVASVSGAILAVCSCTVLPMFAGIYARGAGIGPATTFLYAGPAINVLAIILTARVLGYELGIARGVGAIAFSIIIGLLMSFFFKDKQRVDEELTVDDLATVRFRSLTQNALYFSMLIMVLIFAAWAKPEEAVGFWNTIYSIHWYLTAAALIILLVMLLSWFKREEIHEWVFSSWTFAKQILPLLFAGVFIAGFLLGRPNTNAGILPAQYVALLVGGNSIGANFFASIAGAFMYFATLTEVPILQGLLGSGMGKGPALSLLLAGPAVSLPSILVVHSIIGFRKTVGYVLLVVTMSSLAGWVFGTLF